jgi:hypothetical protein
MVALQGFSIIFLSFFSLLQAFKLPPTLLLFKLLLEPRDTVWLQSGPIL